MIVRQGTVKTGSGKRQDRHDQVEREKASKAQFH